MYQSKSELRARSSSVSLSNPLEFPETAVLAWTRCCLEPGISQSGSVRGNSDVLPLTRSKIRRIAMQNSSKSNCPSTSMSERSHTFSSCAWSNREFLNTTDTLSPLSLLLTGLSPLKICQYFLISHSSSLGIFGELFL
ncbi:hypothetical protein OGAPHI_002131 [Ogataea philodendri]|uniref:Uncharacterized protein n=1 Tax=Ogataea philodendri TaxID=1378263 RepID=A0A9P8PAM8_9ASCO|nr:uncharacterized protein OGAPHI_002131 [Ogataea philodendri]KAH3668377.1 hypothetical protein OGAPHI_002131 [Ogataea philodendri]